MAIKVKIKDTEFGVGDKIRVIQKIKEAKRERNQSFEGVVIAIRGKGSGKSFVVRRIGANNIGIEKIFPVASPLIVGVEVIKMGTRGVRKSKLYYLRKKPSRSIGTIYQKASKREGKSK